MGHDIPDATIRNQFLNQVKDPDYLTNVIILRNKTPYADLNECIKEIRKQEDYLEMNVNEAKSAKVYRLAMRRVTFDNDKPQEPPTKRRRITIPWFITFQVKDELRPVLYAWAKLASQKNGDCTKAEVMNKVKHFQRQRPV